MPARGVWGPWLTQLSWQVVMALSSGAALLPSPVRGEAGQVSWGQQSRFVLQKSAPGISHDVPTLLLGGVFFLNKVWGGFF